MIIEVKVKTGCREERIEKLGSGILVVNLKKRPQENQANEELVKVLAKYYSVLKSNIEIKSGLTSRHKLIKIGD